MVKSTTIVRASDALPLAATVDDEQVGLDVEDVASVLTSLTDRTSVART